MNVDDDGRRSGEPISIAIAIWRADREKGVKRVEMNGTLMEELENYHLLRMFYFPISSSIIIQCNNNHTKLMTGQQSTIAGSEHF